MVAAASPTEPFDLLDCFAPRLPNLIGRQKFVHMIRQAIANDSGKSHVFYFVAAGGMGKTRLLEEVGALPGQQNSFLWSGIIDLYHSETHSPGGLRAAIARGFDPGGASFREYWELRQQFQDRRSAGEMGPALETLQQRLDEVFLEEYAALASRHRLVLCFDTLELIQYESDTVQQICQVDDISTLIKNWLVAYIPRLPNTVTIFAGRPRPDDRQQKKLDQEFQQAFAVENINYHRESLDVLSDGEFQAYLEAMQQQRPRLREFLNSPEIIAQISDLTARNPIRIGLVVDLLLNDKVLGEIAPGKIDTEWLSVVRGIPAPYPYGKILWFMLYARHGVDVDLVRYLINEPELENRLDSLLEEIGQLQLVKKHPGIRRDALMTEQSLPSENAVTRGPERTERLFLHDELYDMFDREHKSDPQVRREFQSFRNYYQQLEEQSELLDEKKQDIRIALLYYELQVNANEAYHTCYARWDEEAIKGYETGFDMRLRDEVLRFFNRYVFNERSPFYSEIVAAGTNVQAIHRDCAVRWVKRYVARGDHPKAASVAQAIRNAVKQGFAWSDTEVQQDHFYRAGLLAAWAGAMIFTNTPRHTIETYLREAREILVKMPDPARETDKWLRARTLGTVNNSFGYLSRVHGQYGDAVSWYSQALKHFRTVDILDERANTLNNLAYIKALLGQPRLAREYIEEAILIRERLGKQLPLALSYNTRALTYIFEDYPELGIELSKRALEICKELQNNRVIGMCYNALGLGLRKKGDLWKKGKYSFAEAAGYYQEAVTYLEQAKRIFSEQVVEPARLWEASNELGSVYCDWGWLAGKSKQWEQARDHYVTSIDYQRKALKTAEGAELDFQIADSHDDLAQAHGDQALVLIEMGHEDEAKRSLDRAKELIRRVIEDLIPADYRLKPGAGFREMPGAGAAFLQSLGKAYLWLGVWGFRFDAPEIVGNMNEEARHREAAANLIRSAAYFHRFAAGSFAEYRSVKYVSGFASDFSKSREWSDERIREIEELYDVNLDFLHDHIAEALG